MLYFEELLFGFDVAPQVERFDISGGLPKKLLFGVRPHGGFLIFVVFVALIVVFVVVHLADQLN